MRCDSINLVPFNVSKNWIGRDDERTRESLRLAQCQDHLGVEMISGSAQTQLQD